MSNLHYEEMFPWEIAKAMAEAPVGYLPLGTLEWHGEHNVVGLDTLKAQAICMRAAEISGGVVLPPFYWATDWREDQPDGSYVTGGIEFGERYHVPGSMFWLRPKTYLNLLLDVYEAMRRRGFKVIVVLCGHWARDTLPVVRRSGEQFQVQHPEIKWMMVSDLELGEDVGYLHEHAARGETSLMLAIRPELVRLELVYETDKSLREYYSGTPEHLRQRRETQHKYIGILTAAADGSNDPEMASAEHGRFLLETIAARLAKRACAMLSQTQVTKEQG